MIEAFLYITDMAEQKAVSQQIENKVAFLTEDALATIKVRFLDDAYKYLYSGNKTDISVIEINNNNEIKFLERFRERCKSVYLMLIADSNISPMSYLNPKIKASALLLSPYQPKDLKVIIEEFIADYFNDLEEQSEQNVFVINTKDGKELVPFSSVFYIEVREKHVFVRLQNKEFSQFGTLESVSKQLPDYFLRCHRSYIINTKHLSKIKFSENIIFLKHGIMVPLSRSYKKDIKEYLSSERISG